MSIYIKQMCVCVCEILDRIAYHCEQYLQRIENPAKTKTKKIIIVNVISYFSHYHRVRGSNYDKSGFQWSSICDSSFVFPSLSYFKSSVCILWKLQKILFPRRCMPTRNNITFCIITLNLNLSLFVRQNHGPFSPNANEPHLERGL